MRKTWKKLAAMAVTASMVICGGAMGVSAATEEEKPEKVTVNVNVINLKAEDIYS